MAADAPQAAGLGLDACLAACLRALPGDNVDAVKAVLSSTHAGASLLRARAPGPEDKKGAREGGWTLLHHAALLGSTRTLALLIDQSADVNATTGFWKSTPLHRAAKGGSPTAAEILVVQGGAAVDAPAKGRYTPLMDACTYGHAACAKMLLDKGADPRLQSTLGRTALHYAAGYGHGECAEVLLSAAPHLAQARDLKGTLPADLAARYGNACVGAVLRAHAGDAGGGPTASTRPADVGGTEDQQGATRASGVLVAGDRSQSPGGCPPHAAALRIDVADGRAYSLDSFIEVYGGSQAQPPVEWVGARAPPTAREGGSEPSPKRGRTA